MTNRIVRRTFFKHLLSISAFGAGSLLTLKKNTRNLLGKIGVKNAHAAGNRDYAMGTSDGIIKIEYVGLSCFIITASNGTRIITDPFVCDKTVLHSGLKKEPADIVTVSCGHYAHCYVYAVGGAPYIYKITEPATLEGITFRGIASRHLTMKEVTIQDPGDNVIICFTIDGIRICHLGALGHVLTDEQVKQIGPVDILMVPVGGVSTLPVADATRVCSQLGPKIVLPMNYRSERLPIEGWATVDDFLADKADVVRCDSNVGSSELEFSLAQLPPETRVMVPRFVY
jgi:L-ascorbate metabolism protein UlaG (beta-lactamase superfamily)